MACSRCLVRRRVEDSGQRSMQVDEYTAASVRSLASPGETRSSTSRALLLTRLSQSSADILAQHLRGHDWSFALPENAKEDGITATLNNGVLNVNV
eukprot:1101328-Pelagomonas_calceolata.AAC.1